MAKSDVFDFFFSVANQPDANFIAGLIHGNQFHKLVATEQFLIVIGHQNIEVADSSRRRGRVGRNAFDKNSLTVYADIRQMTRKSWMHIPNIDS
jgi:hypothetical protein